MSTPTTEVFVDTSALYAFLVAEDTDHARAREIMASLRTRDAVLVSSTFVVQEIVALLQSRIGVGAVRTFQRDVLPVLDTVVVDRPLLDRAMETLLAASRRNVSLTDWSSFAIMRERGIDEAFAFDADFSKQGFALVIP